MYLTKHDYRALQGSHICKLQAKRTLLMRHEAEIKSNAYWLGLLAHLQASSVPRKVKVEMSLRALPPISSNCRWFKLKRALFWGWLKLKKSVNLRLMGFWFLVQDISCIKDLTLLYEAAGIEDVYVAYEQLKVDEDSLYSCIGIAGAQEEDEEISGENIIVLWRRALLMKFNLLSKKMWCGHPPLHLIWRGKFDSYNYIYMLLCLCKMQHPLKKKKKKKQMDQMKAFPELLRQGVVYQQWRGLPHDMTLADDLSPSMVGDMCHERYNSYLLFFIFFCP